MQYKYLLSVIIPTRNRQKYALAAVTQAYNVTDERVQIVVSDNSDDDSLAKDIAAQNYTKRVKYKYIPERIPGVDNYISGITMSEGEYLCNIGDDDGIMRYITDVVEWAKSNDIEAITPSINSQYFWPGVYEAYPNGRLDVDVVKKDYLEIKSPKEGLSEVLKNGGVEFYKFEVAKMYHGIVKKDHFEKVNQITGKYCGGLVPDVYLSTAFSLIIEKVLFIGLPLIIPGVCAASESGRTANKKDYGELKDFTYWCGQEYTWSNRVPYFYSSNTIWADSLMHSLEDMGRYEMADLFDFKKFTVACIELYPKYKKRLRDFYYKNSGEQIELSKSDLSKAEFVSYVKAIPWKMGRKLPPKLKRLIKRMLGMSVYLTEEVYKPYQHKVSDIITAEELLYSIMKDDVHEYMEQMVMEQFKRNQEQQPANYYNSIINRFDENWLLHFDNVYKYCLRFLLECEFIKPSDFIGKKILDFGGSHGQLALCFLNEGAESVTVVDPYLPEQLFKEHLYDCNSFKYYNGTIQDYEINNPQIKFDFIISHCVTEHILDLHSCLKTINSLLSDEGIFIVVHDNYFHPSGAHDNTMLTENSGSYLYEGPKCWETLEKCVNSVNFRKANPFWGEEESQITPDECSNCLFYKRTQPWAHLLYQDEFNDIFIHESFHKFLNKFTPFQLRQYLIESEFVIDKQKRINANNEIPQQLFEFPFYLSKEDLLTVTICIRAKKIIKNKNCPNSF